MSAVLKNAIKSPGLNGTRTDDHCDTDAVLDHLSFQANWELVSLWVCNIPMEDDYIKVKFIKDIFELQVKDIIESTPPQLRKEILSSLINFNF